MLEVKNITLKPLFENVNFEIEKWLVIFSWPSGSWKTTLLKTIGWFIKPDSWKIILSSHKISNNHQIPIWFHFQDYNLLDLDVKTNIELPFTFWKYKKNEKWINYLLDYFEIKKLINKDINQISGWEMERVSIVKAFVNKPYLVLLDEAWAALNEELRNKLYNFIKDYSKNNIVVLITHDNNFIQQLNLKKVYNWNFKILISQ